MPRLPDSTSPSPQPDSTCHTHTHTHLTSPSLNSCSTSSMHLPSSPPIPPRRLFANPAVPAWLQHACPKEVSLLVPRRTKQVALPHPCSQPSPYFPPLNLTIPPESRWRSSFRCSNNSSEGSQRGRCAALPLFPPSVPPLPSLFLPFFLPPSVHHTSPHPLLSHLPVSPFSSPYPSSPLSLPPSLSSHLPLAVRWITSAAACSAPPARTRSC